MDALGWSDLALAAGLFLLIEGLVYAAAPEAMRRALLEFLALPEQTRRTIGLAMAVFGFVIVWLVRR